MAKHDYCARCGVSRREARRLVLGCSAWGKAYPRHVWAAPPQREATTMMPLPWRIVPRDDEPDDEERGFRMVDARGHIVWHHIRRNLEDIIAACNERPSLLADLAAAEQRARDAEAQAKALLVHDVQRHLMEPFARCMQHPCPRARHDLAAQARPAEPQEGSDG